jgi:cytochrome c-type biogenesis protein CcmH
MDSSAARPVRRPPKPNAQPQMSDAARDDLEHQVRCMCGCTLSVYICRTTDFTCPISPAMHADVQSLVAGGYSAGEILDAFIDTYGERVLMAPRRRGFNWAGYIVPFIALAAGAAVVTFLLRRWTRASASAPQALPAPSPGTGSPEELARLHAAVRNDDDDA